MIKRGGFTLILRKAFPLERKKAFTLIESLAVIAIIGILTTLATTITLGAQRSSRDVKRKNDLYAISQGFDARKLDRTCNNELFLDQYPRVDGSAAGWILVSQLGTEANINNPCSSFSEYLKTIPTDPQPAIANYYYNLSAGASLAKHYRLAASLERSNSTLADCQHNSDLWISSVNNGSKAYDCTANNANGSAIPGSRGYQYYIGK